VSGAGLPPGFYGSGQDRRVSARSPRRAVPCVIGWTRRAARRGGAELASCTGTWPATPASTPSSRRRQRPADPPPPDWRPLLHPCKASSSSARPPPSPICRALLTAVDLLPSGTNTWPVPSTGPRRRSATCTSPRLAATGPLLRWALLLATHEHAECTGRLVPQRLLPLEPEPNFLVRAAMPRRMRPTSYYPKWNDRSLRRSEGTSVGAPLDQKGRSFAVTGDPSGWPRWVTAARCATAPE
jgi:hypothetical protein